MHRIDIYKLTEEEYYLLKASGHMWEVYPTATGSYYLDVVKKLNEMRTYNDD